MSEWINDGELLRFVAESNHIEGIHRRPTNAEIEATDDFLALLVPRVQDVIALVEVYQPDARLRNRAGLNVRVGNHIAPPGHPDIEHRLQDILDGATRTIDPWTTHVRYETLHPFTDGNGRSGRALWAWQMVREQDGLPLAFLHQFYYQTLSGVRRGSTP